MLTELLGDLGQAEILHIPADDRQLVRHPAPHILQLATGRQALTGGAKEGKDALDGLKTDPQHTRQIFLAKDTPLQIGFIGQPMHAQPPQGFGPFPGPHLYIALILQGHQLTAPTKSPL